MNCILFYGNNVMPGISKYAGPARLATELRDNGFETICIDIGTLTYKESLPMYEKIINKFVTKDTLWLGFSTTFFDQLLGVPMKRITNQTDFNSTAEGKATGFMEEILNLCRLRNPNIKFIVGGGLYINLHQFDFYHFRGYADREIVEFTKWCKDSSYAPRLNRLGKIITGQEYDNFVSSKIKWHETDLITPGLTLPIEISRGCIFRCKFCAFPLNGKTKGEWVKHLDILKEELIENYERFGTTEYNFADDTYNDSIVKITDLYEHVFSKLPFQIKWTSYMRLDLIHRFRESIDILGKSGLKCALFGMETNNDKSAKAIGKGLSFDKQIELLKELKAGPYKDVLLSSGFIYGLPHDTLDTITELHKWLLSSDNPLDHWVVAALSLNPPNLTYQKSYFSEIDLNYEKYGYAVTEAERYLRTMRWTHPTNNLSFDQCVQLASTTDFTSSILANFKGGSFMYPRLRSMGVSEEELMTLPYYEIRKRYPPGNMIENWRVDYFNKLLSL